MLFVGFCCAVLLGTPAAAAAAATLLEQVALAGNSTTYLVDHPCGHGKDPCACQMRCLDGACQEAQGLCATLPWCDGMTHNLGRRRVATLKTRGPAWRLVDVPAPRPMRFVVGEQKCGTTAVFAALFLGRKEWHLFDSHRVLSACRFRSYSTQVDATPDYFGDPVAAVHLAASFPESRVLILTRDPVERAHAAWDQNRRSGAEGRTLEMALRAEIPFARRCSSLAERLPRVDVFLPYSEECLLYDGKPQNCWTTRSYDQRPNCKRYLQKGFYGHHLAVWVELFPPSRLAMADAAGVFDGSSLPRIADFFGLPLRSAAARAPNKPCWHDCAIPKQSVLLTSEMRLALADLYAPSQARLAALQSRVTLL